MTYLLIISYVVFGCVLAGVFRYFHVEDNVQFYDELFPILCPIVWPLILCIMLCMGIQNGVLHLLTYKKKRIEAVTKKLRGY